MATPGCIAGKVCIVTGATRGIGKGIAIQLADNGATVYITGRTMDPQKSSQLGGCLRDTAAEIKARGRGQCIPVVCDHSKDDDIKQLFEKVNREQNGQLDVLVNNAYSALHNLFINHGVKFWDQPLAIWDDVNNVGLKNNYLCSVYASKLMVPRKRGLIVNISSIGGLRFLFTPSYGIGKEACDRMAADCAVELRESGVAFVSLWPGAVATEEVLDTIFTQNSHSLDLRKDGLSEKSKTTLRLGFRMTETPDFVGKCLVQLASDPNIMVKSGKILLTADIGNEYGLKDVEGHTPVNIRQINHIFPRYFPKLSWLNWMIPNFVRIPKSLLCIVGNKF